MLIWR